ncbi:VanZ family protein [Planctomycetota bacterium]
MAKSIRQKLTLTTLALYWPVLFILAHIPIPRLLRQAHVSDKNLHFMAYLILIFLAWFSIRPDKKVNWRKAAVWWVLAVMVGYGILDELLQGYVGRSCDLRDLLADIEGIMAGLLLFTLLTFWPALLMVTGIAIFLLTNLAKVNPADLLPVATPVFYFFAYAFLTIVWIQCKQLTVDKLKDFVTTLALPSAFLLVVKGFTIILNRNFALYEMTISAAGILVVTIIYRICRPKQKNPDKPPM